MISLSHQMAAFPVHQLNRILIIIIAALHEDCTKKPSSHYRMAIIYPHRGAKTTIVCAYPVIWSRAGADRQKQTACESLVAKVDRINLCAFVRASGNSSTTVVRHSESET